MMRQVAPVLLATALVVAPVTGFALDRASAAADQGRVAMNDVASAGDASQTVTPKPIKKKLHRGWPKKVHAAPTNRKKAVPTAASETTTKAN